MPKEPTRFLKIPVSFFLSLKKVNKKLG